ncbi:hypothetical protein AT4157R_810008 [Escherichia coli]|nr:hypothetical protein AT4157R_810008 [Escherichia coli]
MYVTGGAGDEREYKEDDACHLRDVTDGHEWCVAVSGTDTGESRQSRRAVT